MKISWISDSPRLVLVGQSVVGRNYLSRFKQLGHEVQAIGFNDSNEKDQITEVDYPVYSVPRGEDGIDAKALINIVQQHPADVTVLSHDPFLFEMIGDLKPHCKRLVGYYTIDAEPLPEIWAKTLYYCDDIIVPCKYGRRVIKERYPDLDVNVVPYGVDTSLFKLLTKEEKEKVRKDIGQELSRYSDTFKINFDGKFVAIFYGHNQGKKNLLASKVAWEQFSKNKNDVLFVLVTHTRYIKVMGWTFPGEFNLKDFVNVKGLVLLPTVLPEIGLKNLIGLADVLLFPTIGECPGLPNLECMAAGTLPLTTYFAGPTEFLTNENSFPLYKWTAVPGTFSTVRAGVDTTYLANRLEEAYKMWKTDQPRWQAMQQNAINTAKRYNWDNSTKQFLDIINKPKVDRTWQLFQL